MCLCKDLSSRRGDAKGYKCSKSHEDKTPGQTPFAPVNYLEYSTDLMKLFQNLSFESSVFLLERINQWVMLPVVELVSVVISTNNIKEEDVL